MKVPYINLGLQHQQLHDELMAEISKILNSGQFIMGGALTELEKNFASMCGTKYALGVANGTDALILAMKALGIGEGDEVITAPNSYLASASSIALCGAVPVFADVREDMNIDPVQIRKVITPKTRAIIAVHLTGKPAAMDEISEIAREFNLFIIEDAAQAVGASYNKQMVGSIGTLGAFSLHPLKNLAACGDGGMITCSDQKVYQYLLKARNHGLKNRDECEFFSLNSRLDNLQAAIVNVKLKFLENWNRRRRQIAERYNKAFRNLVRVPEILDSEYAVYHTYIIQTDRRDELMKYLGEKGIETKIHYPVAIHRQEASKAFIRSQTEYVQTDLQTKRILSLPVYPELSDEQLDYIIEEVSSFFTNK